MKRYLALLLTFCLLLGNAAVAEEIATPSDIATQAPTAEPTVEPTAVPTEEPTVEPTAEPTEVPTEEPTIEPTAEPTAEPTEAPTAEPTAELAPTPEPTPEPWDEALCDHANELCQQAPLCETEGCWHIGLDANGLEIPLCDKGRWLLDQQDALQRGGAGSMARTVRSNTIDLGKGDAAIYRSGSYQVSGSGGGLTIAPNRLVVLTMTEVTAKEVRLGEHASLTLKLRGQNKIELLALGNDNEVRIPEGGALTLDEVKRPENSPGKISITGGSVLANLTEAAGRQRMAFPAAGMAAVTVNGEAWNATCTHEDGQLYLWLPAAQEGSQWTATMEGNTLAVTLVETAPLPTDTPEPTSTPEPTEEPLPTDTPAPTAVPVFLTVQDGKGQAVANAAMTVQIGETRGEYTTDAQGVIYLPGMDSLEGWGIAATDGQNVYTGVVMNGSAVAIPGLTIQNVKAVDSGNAVTVTFTCEGAKAVGVQALVGDAPQQLPDDYVPDALRFAGSDGQVTITGLTPGQTVSLRVYACNAEGAALTAESADGFQFGELVHITTRRPWTTDASADAAYTGKAYRNRLDIPEEAEVSYTGKHLNSSGKPVRVGDYTMHVTIPEGSATWLPGTVEIPFSITRAVLTISPEPNQEKYMGEKDPVFSYTVKGLLEGDALSGELTRQSGEDVGSYAFLTDGFVAADHYRLRIASDAPVFTILPAPAVGGGGVYEVLRPVKQEITRADGRTLYVMLNAQDTLNVRWSSFGQVMFGSADDKVRPFHPSLTWNQETDQVLLRLRAEAELNKDGGYQTDLNGQPLRTGRYLRMGVTALRHLQELGVDALSVSNGEVALTVPISSFLTPKMEQLVKEHRGNMASVRFRLDLIPAEAAAQGLQSVSQGWQVGACMLIGRESIDITGQLPGLTVAVDVEPVAELLKAMQRYDEQAFATRFTLGMETTQGAKTLESTLVQPFAADELTLAAYPCVLYTHRYLTTSLTEPGLLWMVEGRE